MIKMMKLTGLLGLTLCATGFAETNVVKTATNGVAAVAQEKDWEPMPKPKILPDRYTLWHEEAAKGPHMKVVAATFFGGKGDEEFVAAGELTDGSVVAIGNAWGPEFPAQPATEVLGKGAYQGTNSTDGTDRSGIWVLYAAGLKSAKKVIRFDWGVAQISTGRVTPDGRSLILAGRAGAAFRAFAKNLSIQKVEVAEPTSGRTKGKAVATPSGDVYVAKLDAATGAIQWAFLWETAGKAPTDLWFDKTGAVYFDIRGLRKIDGAGKETKLVNAKSGNWLGVDPEDGGVYFGGDRNTKTRREPWRQPYLYKYNATGEKVWKLWEADPKDVGSDHAGLESDSAIRGVDTLSDGNLIVAGWSDGGNSVFWRQATDWKRNCPNGGFMSPWYPSGANSFGHLTVVNPKTLETKLHAWWVAVLPMSNAKPNRIKSARIHHVTALSQDAVAFTGDAGTGLIQTPNSFWKPTGTNYFYHGETLGVWDKDFKNLLFSSYLPACENVRVFPAKKGLLCVSRSTGGDTNEPRTPSPAQGTLQPFGGATDGHLLYLELP